MRTNLENGAEAPGAGVARSLGWRAPVLLFLALFVVFGLTATRGVASTDDHAPAVEAWRIASSGSPWLEGVLDKHIDPDPWLHEVANGHVVADRMAGPVIICVPFYWLFNDSPNTRDFSLKPAGFAAALVTAGTGCLMFLALRRRLGRPVATIATLGFALATPTWSVSADGPWTHTVTQFGLAGAAYGASRNRWWVAGAFCGAAMFGRPHLAVVAAILGLGMACSRRSLRVAVQVGLPSLAALGLLFLWNRAMFGIWSVASAGYAGRADNLVTTSQLTGWQSYVGFLVAPDRGFFVWTPVVLVLVPAVVRAWPELPAWSKWLALAGAAYTLVQLRLNGFTGGDFFYGYRHGLELLTCLTPMLAFALPKVGNAARTVASLVLCLQFGAILLGASAEKYFVDQENVWRDNSFLMAIRERPGAMVTWVALCLVLGVLGGYLANRWSRSAADTLTGYRRSLDPVE